MSFNSSTFPALAVDTGTEVMLDTYNAEGLFYPQFTEVIDPTQMSHPIKGDKSTTMVDGVNFARRGNGEEFHSTDMGQGYIPQGALQRYGASISFDEDDLRSIEANPKASIQMVATWAQAVARQSEQFKERYVAAAFARGAIDTGILDVEGVLLDQSFLDNVDPNPGLGYDGVPWFDAAHPIKFGSATFANYVASATLSQTTISAANTLMTVTNARDERNRVVRIESDAIMVPGSLGPALMRELDTQTVTGSGNNDVSLINSLGLRPIINPYLDEFDADGWFLLGKERAVRVIDSGVPVIRSFIDEKTRSLVLTAQYHFGLYLRNWRYAVASGIPTT